MGEPGAGGHTPALRRCRMATARCQRRAALMQRLIWAGTLNQWIRRSRPQIGGTRAECSRSRPKLARAGPKFGEVRGPSRVTHRPQVGQICEGLDRLIGLCPAKSPKTCWESRITINCWPGRGQIRRLRQKLARYLATSGPNATPGRSKIQDTTRHAVFRAFAQTSFYVAGGLRETLLG